MKNIGPGAYIDSRAKNLFSTKLGSFSKAPRIKDKRPESKDIHVGPGILFI